MKTKTCQWWEGERCFLEEAFAVYDGELFIGRVCRKHARLWKSIDPIHRTAKIIVRIDRKTKTEMSDALESEKDNTPLDKP